MTKSTLTFLATIALSSLALPTKALPPLGRYTVTVDTVRDNRTLLTWQRVPSPDVFTQAQAALHCANLNPAGRWRAPTMNELVSLIGVDTNVVVDWSGDGFWSSSKVVGSPGAGWVLMPIVPNGDGSITVVDSAPNDLARYRVRCVRNAE